MRDAGSRIARWVALVSLGLARLRVRATRTAPRQVALTVAGVAIPVALMLLVTGVSIGLATGTTVASDDVDYWIVPESEASSAVVAVGGPQFGQVHPVAARLADRPDVDSATPVLLSLVRAHAGEESEFVLAVGLVPPPAPIEVAGVSTAGLSEGDPHYADGEYDGPRTDEAVLSDGAAELLGVTVADTVELRAGSRSNRTVKVVNVSQSAAEVGGLPVVVVHLSELQTVTGAANGDRADQLLVRTSDPGVRPALEAVYPGSTVLARGDIGSGQVLDSDLGLAMALTGLLVAVIVGALFAATTIGLAVADDAPQRTMLAAIGLSGRSRAVLVSTEALAVTLLGGLVGVLLGFTAVPAANAIARRFVGDIAVVEARPTLAVYGLAVAAIIGLLVVPYLLYLGRRTLSLEALYD